MRIISLVGMNRKEVKSMKDREKSELLLLMEQCGHFLHHRRGGKRGQGRILRILMKEEEMTQKELQERLGIQSGSMSEIVLKLEGRGFIAREREETDKRKIKLKITEAGRTFFEERQQEMIEGEKSLFNGLTQDEQEILKGLLTKLLKDWESNFDKSLLEPRKKYKEQQ